MRETLRAFVASVVVATFVHCDPVSVNLGDLQKTQWYPSDETWITKSSYDYIFNRTHGVGAYFSESASASTFEQCQELCIGKWVCTGIYYGPTEVTTSGNACVLMSSSYRILASSPDRYLGSTTYTSSAGAPLTFAFLSTNYQHWLKTSFYTDAWVDFDNFVEGMTLWELMARGVGDETNPYLGLRFNTLFPSDDSTWRDGNIKNAYARMSFIESRAPDALTTKVNNPDGYRYFDSGFFPRKQNPGLVTVVLQHDESAVETCGEVCDKLFYPKVNTCVAYSENRIVEGDYQECSLYLDVSRLSQTDDIIYESSHVLKGLFTSLALDFTVYLPDYFGVEAKWADSIGQAEWNTSNIVSPFRISRSILSTDNLPLYVRNSYKGEITANEQELGIFSLDCSSYKTEKLSDFCTLGTNKRSVSPFASGKSILLSRPASYVWDDIKCRAMCRYNNDFCLGFNVWDDNCELLTDSSLVAGSNDLNWPSNNTALDCTQTRYLNDCQDDEVVPYRITSRGDEADISEFVTNGCRSKLKNVREGNCVGDVRSDMVMALDVPTSNIEIFDSCSDICCEEDDWCGGLEYVTRRDNGLYKRCNFLFRTRTAIVGSLSWTTTSSGIKLYNATRELISNNDATSITCVAKPDVSNPYLDTGSAYMYTGGPRCVGASGTAPIVATFESDLATENRSKSFSGLNEYDLDALKIGFCRDFCASQSTFCKGFMASFKDRTETAFACSMYTSIKAFWEAGSSALTVTWNNFINAGDNGATVPQDVSFSGRVLKVSQMYDKIAHPDRDAMYVIASTEGGVDLTSSVCYSRYDYDTVFAASKATRTNFKTLNNTQCDYSTAFVLRHQSGFTGTAAADKLREFCQNVCSEQTFVCRGFMIDSTNGYCTIYPNLDAVAMDTTVLPQLSRMADVQSTLMSEFRFIKICAADDESDAACADIPQDVSAIDTGVRSNGQQCFVNVGYFEPQSEQAYDLTRIYIIVGICGGVLFICCFSCYWSDRASTLDDEQTLTVRHHREDADEPDEETPPPKHHSRWHRRHKHHKKEEDV